MLNTVAIILARGGSKGIPGKNVKPFCGKPLVEWTIEHALGTQSISSVWVSSDDKEILNIARQAGAECIVRPEEISGDRATSESGWLHAIDYIEKHSSKKIDLVVAPQVTSPLRTSEDFENGIQSFQKNHLDSLFSASPLGDFFIWTEGPNGELASLNYDYKNRKRRQDIATQYVENGSFYIFKPEILREFNNRMGGKMGLVEQEFWKCFEINSIDDFQMCEVLMKHYLVKEE